MPKISLVTLCYNQLENATVPMLNSLYRYTDPESFELIIVNNASTDGTKEFLENFKKEKNNVKVINNEANLGFSAGMNSGMREAQGDFIFLLNNDLLFTPNWLNKLVAILEENKKIGLISCLTNYCGEEFQLVDKAEEYTKDNYLELSKELKGNEYKLIESTRVVFFCVGITRQTINKVGYFDENFGQCWFEDDDYTIRTLYSGLKIAVAQSVFIYHNHSQSTSRFSKTDEGKKLFQKNKEYFENKHELYSLLKKQAVIEMGKEFSKFKRKYNKYRKLFNILLPVVIIEFIIIIIELSVIIFGG